jgi:predicted metal-dependent phosphoesterase TrpH
LRSMLSYMRNKLMSVAREDENTLIVYGVLDDDLYGLWMDVRVSLAELTIVSVEAGWNRWTTPECHLAIEPMQEAVGMRIEAGLRRKVQMTISRRACRHFANLLLECCHAAKEAAEGIKSRDQENVRAARAASRDGNEALLRAGDQVESVGERKRQEDPSSRIVSGGTMIDLHVHTSKGSSCSSADVDALIEEAKRIGLDGICLTDHNHVWQPEALEELRHRHGFLILGGNEITTDQGDILVFGLDKDIRGIIRLEKLKEEVGQAGAIMIAAHPFRGFLVFDTAQLGLTLEKASERRLFKWVDAIEVMNSKVTKEENDFAARVAEGLGMPGTGGSDAHDVKEVGLYATFFPGAIHNEKELVEALRCGEGVPVAFRKNRELLR